MDNQIWTDQQISNFIDALSVIAKKNLNCKKEETKPKDYEILSYSYKNRIYTKNNLGEFLTGFDAPVHLLILHPENMTEIHSVKRLSDDEIFSVGDKIGWGYAYNFETIIKGFEIEDRELVIIWDCDKSTNLKVNFKDALKLHKKAEEVLFTTEDGKEIYEGDKVSLLSTSRWHIVQNVSAPINPFYGDNNEGFKYFSTVEKADEWILENKPLLSLNEIFNIIDDGLVPSIEAIDDMRRLKRLAKSKLNQ